MACQKEQYLRVFLVIVTTQYQHSSKHQKGEVENDP